MTKVTLGIYDLMFQNAHTHTYRHRYMCVQKDINHPLRTPTSIAFPLEPNQLLSGLRRHWIHLRYNPPIHSFGLFCTYISCSLARILMPSTFGCCPRPCANSRPIRFGNIIGNDILTVTEDRKFVLLYIYIYVCVCVCACVCMFGYMRAVVLPWNRIESDGIQI